MAKHLLAPPQGRCIPLQSQDALCRVLPPPLFTFIYHYLTQVEALLLKINSRKSCGYDGIPPRLVKESANAIAGPIAAIMNHSIRTGQYPSGLKSGQVTPLFKKGR